MNELSQSGRLRERTSHLLEHDSHVLFPKTAMKVIKKETGITYVISACLVY